MARADTATSLRVLKGIMTNKDCQDSARVAAAIAILDRGWGKPAQSLTGTDGEDEIRVTIRHLVDLERSDK